MLEPVQQALGLACALLALNEHVLVWRLSPVTGDDSIGIERAPVPQCDSAAASALERLRRTHRLVTGHEDIRERVATAFEQDRDPCPAAALAPEPVPGPPVAELPV